MAIILILNTGGCVYTTPRSIEEIIKICKQTGVNVNVENKFSEVDCVINEEDFDKVIDQLA